MMLHAEDPYDALVSGKAAPRQQLRVVNTDNRKSCTVHFAQPLPTVAGKT